MSEPLPPRDANTMSDAIAMSSPSGSMSKRARKVADQKLKKALFGDWTPEPPKQSVADKVTQLRSRAKFLRHLADSGMKPRKYKAEAEKIEAEINALAG